MLNMPIIKFEKSVNYLTNQLEIQENNKQLLLDITANIKLMSNSDADNQNLNNLLNQANVLLQKTSTNITSIEQSELEISNITNELSNLLNDKNRTSKTKEYYIVAFSNIKNSIVTYTNNFIELQKELENDNNRFNEFINVNNFKYNFTSVSNDKSNNSEEYKYTGFSIDDSEIKNNNLEDIEDVEINKNTDTDIISNTNDNADDYQSISIEDLFLLEDLSNDINLQDELIPDIGENNSSNEIKNDIIDDNDNIDENIIDDITDNDINVDVVDNNTESNINEDIIEKDNASFEELLLDNLSLEDLDLQISDENTDTSEINMNEDVTSDITPDINEELLDEISLEDLSKDFELDNIEPEVVENTVFNSSESQSTPRIHYSYSELKNELNNMFNEINGSAKENNITTPQEDAYEDEDASNTDNLDDLLIEDIDSILLDNTDIVEDTDNSNELLFDNNNKDNNNEEIPIEQNIELTDNNTKFKETLPNNNFSLIEEGILSEYSSFEPLQKSNTLSDNIETSQNEEKVIESFMNNYNDLIDTGTNEVKNIDLDDLVEDIEINDISTITENFETLDNIEIQNGNEEYDNPEVEIEEKAETLLDEKNKELANSLNKSNTEIDEKIEKIIEAQNDNSDLIISERTHYIYLPYKTDELINYIENYPEVYSSLSDVVKREFVLPFDYYISHPIKSRFEETYNLIKNREHKSSIDALKVALKISKMDNLNPAIIAACKTEYDLNNYLYHLSKNEVKNFKMFNIIYDINPL